jgi:hypothetical protein
VIFLGGKEKMLVACAMLVGKVDFLVVKNRIEKWDSATVARDVKDTLERKEKGKKLMYNY